jgi:proline dehydrogenase
LFVSIFTPPKLSMEADPKVSFENTAVAFKYKSNTALRKANFIFSLVNHPWISSMATSFVKLALKMRLPVESIIRKTVFDHFCGGESIENSEVVIEQLAKYNVHTILDFSVEGENSEAGFDKTLQETLRTVERAQNSPHIPFSVFKVTGLASFELLEKVQKKESLTDEEQKAFERVRFRIHRICEKGYMNNVPILIDAEETWIQEPIDALVYEMMALFNREKTIVYNTYQMYRVDSLKNLREAFHVAVMKGHFLGAKLVRGAYMEKERERAESLGYVSPIYPDKTGTDNAFNNALLFCLENKQRISLMCGSHNEYSNHFLTIMMEKHGLKNQDKRVWFAQLYGMSDNISFNLAREGYCVAKYVPYGPVRSVMPYLLRRAEENTSVAGQSSRELTMIQKELQRRKAEKSI